MRILFWSAIVVLIIRTFVFQVYRVPTGSMKNTLNEGDHVLVDKLAYGPRIPFSLIGIPFTDIYIESLQLPYLRLPGFSTVKNGDIVVFNYPLEDELPIDQRQPYVKRCIAIPGDTLSILNGCIKINNHFPADTQFTKNVDPLDSSVYRPAFFPNNSAVRWNADHFGPLYIPQKGKTILLDKKNLILYNRIITVYEKNSLKTNNDSVFINGQYSSSYSFKMNYFFMVGDNRNSSIDSRFWGFVPEDHLIGRVSE
ncbi:MAG: signal peptidase I [Bacteroidia bacterium]